MSWARTIVTGSGTLNFRIQIEGFPYEPVTDRAMEGASTDGRVRYAGLSSEGITIKERCDLVRAKWEPQGFRVTLVDRKRQWTEAFRQPTKVTWLNGVLTAAATSATVMATVGFATSDKLYLDTEVMACAAIGTAGTTFTGLSRGVWQTLPQSHYVANGERLRYPELTNWPRVREGKRATLWAYGAGDNLASTSPTAGVKIWTGVVSAEPTFDGLNWSFSLDPITRKWDADIGGDLEDPLDIRGIYYPAVAPLTIEVSEHSSIYFGSTSVNKTRFQVAGFWETQEAFCEALTTTLLNRTTAHSIAQIVSAVPVGGSWALEFESAAVSPLAIFAKAESATDQILGERPIDLTTGEILTDDKVLASRRYRYVQSPNGGSFPRATIGSYDPAELTGGAYRVSAADRIGIDPATNPATRVYCGGAVAISATVASAQIEWESNGHSELGLAEPFTAGVDAVSTTNRYIDLDSVRPLRSEAGVTSHYAALGSGIVSMRLGLNYGVGHLGDFITALTGSVAVGLNTGSTPDIRPTDFTAIASTDIPAAASTNPLANNRTYSIFAPVSFADLLEQECRLLGVFPAYASDGTVTFHRLRLPAASEVESATITEADIITGKGEWFTWEVAPLGMFNTVELSTGYDPVEDEYRGTMHRTRDVEAYGRNPDGRTLEIKPKSIDRREGFSQHDVVRQASKILGVFGAPYCYLTIKVKLSRFSTLVGDVVRITWNKIPASDGTLGVTNKIALVVGREWEFGRAHGKLTLLMTDANIAGYVPASKLSAIAGTSGGTGPFSANTDATYFPGSVQAADLWAAGDLIRLHRYDGTGTAGNVTGTISSAVGNALVFSTDSGWSHAAGIGSWAIGGQVSTAITADGQKVYAYIANADATLDWSGDTGNPAQTFGP